MVIASLRGVQNLESLQNFMMVNGLSRVKICSKGAKEMTVDFADRGEMLAFLDREEETFWVKNSNT